MNATELGIFCCWDNNIPHTNTLTVPVLMTSVLSGGRIVLDATRACFLPAVDRPVGCDLSFGPVRVGLVTAVVNFPVEHVSRSVLNTSGCGVVVVVTW